MPHIVLANTKPDVPAPSPDLGTRSVEGTGVLIHPWAQPLPPASFAPLCVRNRYWTGTSHLDSAGAGPARGPFTALKNTIKINVTTLSS